MKYNLQLSLTSLCQEETESSGGIANPNAVSTSLRLFNDYDDRKPSVTSSSGSLPYLPVIMSLGDNLRIEAERQTEEFNHYIRVQEEQFSKGVKEMKERHMASLLCSIEKEVSRRLRDKDLEIERLNRRNQELAEQINQMDMEVQSWQYRAQYNKCVLDALRNDIDQALRTAASDLAKEGCGDSEVNNAALLYQPHHLDNLGRAGAQTMACMSCRSREMCMLLLPCRHLCLCKNCDGVNDTCPICLSLKTGSVEVYMS